MSLRTINTSIIPSCPQSESLSHT